MKLLVVTLLLAISYAQTEAQVAGIHPENVDAEFCVYIDEATCKTDYYIRMCPIHCGGSKTTTTTTTTTKTASNVVEYFVYKSSGCEGEYFREREDGSTFNWGGDLLGIENCKAECDPEPKCAGFTHRHSDDKCSFLKQGPFIINPAEVGGVDCYEKSTELIYEGCYINSGDNLIDSHLQSGWTTMKIDRCRHESKGGFFGLEPGFYTHNQPDHAQCLKMESLPSMDKTSDDECEAKTDTFGRRLGAPGRLAVYRSSLAPADVDECTKQLDNCDENAQCTNTDGGFTCECNAGFSGDGVTCTDINECEGGNNCGVNARCTNTDGGFTCECNAGFTGDGVTCTDINECEGGNNCDVNAECSNTDGGFTCACKEGFSGDGAACTEVPASKVACDIEFTGETTHDEHSETFVFTADHTSYVFDTCGTNWDTMLAILDSNGDQTHFNDDHESDCITGDNQYASHLKAQLTVGEQYSLKINGYCATCYGSFTINVVCPDSSNKITYTNKPGSNQKCEKTGNDEHWVNSRRACENEAKDNNAPYYSFNQRSKKCFYSTTCSNVVSSRRWEIYGSDQSRETATTATPTTTTTSDSPTHYWTIIGSPDYSNHRSGRKRPECLPISSQFSETSNKWGNKLGVACCDDSGTGSRPDCLSGVTFNQANAKCQSEGLRLCTRNEIEEGKARGTGCNFDAYLQWTSTPCDVAQYTELKSKIEKAAAAFQALGNTQNYAVTMLAMIGALTMMYQGVKGVHKMVFATGEFQKINEDEMEC